MNKTPVVYAWTSGLAAAVLGASLAAPTQATMQRGMGHFSVGRLLFRISEEVSAREVGETTPNPARIAPPFPEIFPVELVLRASSGPPTQTVPARPA